jgi:hypothetical protein
MVTVSLDSLRLLLPVADLASTETYYDASVEEGWFPPMWDVARPPTGREHLIPAEFVDLTQPSTWFVKQGSRDEHAVLKVTLGGKLDWPVVLFLGFKDDQSAHAARALALEWVLSQPASHRLDHVPVRSCLTRMFGRNNALLDPSCRLAQVRHGLYTMLGLLGYDLDPSNLRTPVVEIMRPIAQDMRDIKIRIMWRKAKEAGAV